MVLCLLLNVECKCLPSKQATLPRCGFVKVVDSITLSQVHHRVEYIKDVIAVHVLESDEYVTAVKLRILSIVIVVKVEY